MATGLHEASQEQLEVDQMEFDVAEREADMHMQPLEEHMNVQAEEHMNVQVEEHMNVQAEMDLTPPPTEGLTPAELEVPLEEPIQQPNHPQPTIRNIIQNIRRKKSERILMLKLSKRVGGPDALGNSMKKAFFIE